MGFAVCGCEFSTKYGTLTPTHGSRYYTWSFTHNRKTPKSRKICPLVERFGTLPQNNALVLRAERIFWAERGRRRPFSVSVFYIGICLKIWKMTCPIFNENKIRTVLLSWSIKELKHHSHRAPRCKAWVNHIIWHVHSNSTISWFKSGYSGMCSNDSPVWPRLRKQALSLNHINFLSPDQRIGSFVFYFWQQNKNLFLSHFCMDTKGKRQAFQASPPCLALQSQRFVPCVSVLPLTTIFAL